MNKRVSNMQMVLTYERMLLKNRAMMYRAQDTIPTIKFDSVCRADDVISRNTGHLVKMYNFAIVLDNDRLFREARNECGRIFE